MMSIVHEMQKAGVKVSIEYLKALEVEIYTILEWRLNHLTPIEFAKLVLYKANSTYDFSPILLDVSHFVFLCLLGIVLSCLIAFRRGHSISSLR